MTSREEYLQRFKRQLDEWNDDIDELEVKAREAQAGAQARYREQLEALRKMRDDAWQRYTEMQRATVDAWDAMAQGTEKAWHAWVDAFDDARSKFKSKD